MVFMDPVKRASSTYEEVYSIIDLWTFEGSGSAFYLHKEEKIKDCRVKVMLQTGEKG